MGNQKGIREKIRGGYGVFFNDVICKEDMAKSKNKGKCRDSKIFMNFHILKLET